MISDDLFDLRGRFTLVTGATGHLGRSMATALARAGSDLVLASRTQDGVSELARSLADAHGIRAVPIAHDLGRAEAVPGFQAKVEEAIGETLHCLVNNAYSCPAESLEDMTVDAWRQGLEGTLTVPAFLLKAFIPMLEKGQGCVINIGSMYGMVAPHPANYTGTPFGSPPNYGAAKGGLLQFTRYAAAYLADRRIRVNAISPGPFPAPKVQEESGLFIANLQNCNPLGRIGRPEDLGGAVVFLASRASAYMTGHNLVVDGGWTIW